MANISDNGHMLILNLKTYPESSGANLDKLLSIVQSASNSNVWVAPAMLELAVAKQKFPSLQLAAQHTDPIKPGSTTGWVTPESVRNLGIEYTLYNHSEHRRWSETIVEDINFLQAAGLKVVVCCENEVEAEKLIAAQPYAIAFEPADLIGTGKSVSTHRPESVKKFIDVVNGRTKVLIGAGVSNGQDVSAGWELGADGFLLASAFVKAQDPAAVLSDLLNAYTR